MIREYSNINKKHPSNSLHLPKEKGFDLNNFSQEKKQLADDSANYKENSKPITMDQGTQTEMSINQQLSAELHMKVPRRNSTANNINRFYEKANNETANKNLFSKSTDTPRKFVVDPPIEKTEISSSNDTSLHRQEWKEMTEDQEEQQQIEKNRTIIPFGNPLTETKATNPMTYRKQTPTTTIPSLHISADHTPKSTNSLNNLQIKDSPLNDVSQQQEKTFHQGSNSNSIFSDTNPLKPTTQQARSISLTKEILPITDQSSHNTSTDPVKFSLTNYNTPEMWNQNVGWRRDPNLINIGTLEQKYSLNPELNAVKEPKAKTSLERTLIFAREYFSRNTKTTLVRQNQKPTMSIPSKTNNLMSLNNLLVKPEANRSISVPKQGFL
jgi:hypothetical protein